jgi:hypothetical protein
MFFVKMTAKLKTEEHHHHSPTPTPIQLPPSESPSFFNYHYTLKVVGNEKEGGSGMCQTVPICLGPRRSMFFSLLIILCISVSAPVKQTQ